MKSISMDLFAFHCPRWNELPEIELYMDQVVSVIEKYLSIFTDDEYDKTITSTMINNYVKQKAIKPPVKKRYNRAHLAYLFIFCILKHVCSIQEICDFINWLTRLYPIEKAYDLFCGELEGAIHETFHPGEFAGYKGISADEERLPLRTVVLAFANKIYFQQEIKNIKAEMDAEARALGHERGTELEETEKHKKRDRDKSA